MYSEHGKPYYSDAGMMPQEKLAEPRTRENRMSFGIPAERHFRESRILLVPHDAGILAEQGHKVYMQRGAGDGARFTDEDYAAHGVTLVDSAEEIYKADIILKVMPPDLDEVAMMKNRQILFSTLNYNDRNKPYYLALMQKKITAFCLESIRDDDGSYPVIRAMSEIAGNACIYLASRYLSDPQMGQSRMLGGFSGIDPVEIVILGAGTVAEYATRSALGMGAHVRIFDTSIRKIRRLQSLLHERVYTSLLTTEALSSALQYADVVICSMYSHDRITPCILTEDMVKTMKKGSVLLDISIDRGACSETSHVTTHESPVYETYGVIHYCVPNLLSRFANTASNALSNYFYQFFKDATEAGGMDIMLQRSFGLRNAAYIYHGVLTKKSISQKNNIPYKDIHLLISSMSQ